MSGRLVIGIMAIQGAVEEHMNHVKALGHDAKEIRLPSDIEGADGIILPGGESTAMAIVGEKRGLFPALKTWVKEGRPIWGTCAGMILLSDHAIKTAEGGQALLGGLDVQVCRNYFGSQIHSCALDLSVHPSLLNEMSVVDGNATAETATPDALPPVPPSTQPIATRDAEEESFKAVFIRAPAILTAGKAVEVLATVFAAPHSSALNEVQRALEPSESPSSAPSVELETKKSYRVIVAARQGHILATAFHPELTRDLRWHRAFVKMVEQYKR